MQRRCGSEPLHEIVDASGRVVKKDRRAFRGFQERLAAWGADDLFSLLHAPIRRVAALDTHVPYEPTLQQVVLPQIEDITAAATRLVSGA